jgi:RNA polymerase sigma factor (TIGR02999 family)
MAGRHLRSERRGHSLQCTELVNETYLRLFPPSERRFENRRHLFALASMQMRSILVDHARRNGSRKREGEHVSLDVDRVLIYSSQNADELLAIDAALTRLAAIKAEAAQLVEMVYFAGLTQIEAAKSIGCSERTAKRYWQFARAFLHGELDTRCT